jgi:2-polyprenyl-3-methyl-5-hydroxy-6-metoxy-1,4-benzoquinol methylase
MTLRGATSAAHFEALYARSADPWAFETSRYEGQKHRATLAILPRRRFASGLETGCSIGVLTGPLAERCKALVALDVSDTALRRARQRCEGRSHIDFRQTAIPAAWPSGRFDLIVLSEVLYFLGAEGIRMTAQRCAAALAPGGLVLLVNFLGHTDTSCRGGVATQLFLRASRQRCMSGGLVPVRRLQRSSYRLDLLAHRC